MTQQESPLTVDESGGGRKVAEGLPFGSAGGVRLEPVRGLWEQQCRVRFKGEPKVRPWACRR